MALVRPGRMEPPIWSTDDCLLSTRELVRIWTFWGTYNPTSLKSVPTGGVAGGLLDPGPAAVAALGDQVGPPEVQGQLLPGLVPAHRGDPIGAGLLGREYCEQAGRAVTDDRDRLAGGCLHGDRAEPAGAEHVRGGEQAQDEVVGGCLGWRRACRRRAGHAAAQPARRLRPHTCGARTR